MKIFKFSENPFSVWQISIVAIFDAYIGYHQHFTGFGGALVPLLWTSRITAILIRQKIERSAENWKNFIPKSFYEQDFASCYKTKIITNC